jgi:OOP family OmpA-OmpF porin
VRDALVARGLDATKISAQGFGSSQPKVSGSDAAANSANRRIEFTVGGAATAASAPATGKDS